MLSIVKDVLTRLYAFLGGDIYYINSGEALPPPLSREEEAKIMEQLRAGDEEVKQTLIERNLRLVVYIARKFENTGVCVEDLISIGTIGLIKAVNTFDAEKRIKLATYASRCIENEILMYLRRSCKLKLEVSLDEPLNVDWDGNELLLSDILGTDADAIYRGIEDEVDKELLSLAMKKLTPREKKIMELRFGLYGNREYTQKQVADMMGISQSYISRLEKHIIKLLKSEMLHELAARLDTLIKHGADICACGIYCGRISCGAAAYDKTFYVFGFHGISILCFRFNFLQL